MKDQPIQISTDLDEDERIVVIEDDPAVRFGLDSLFRSVGLRSDAFGSVQDFMAKRRETWSGCLVLDVRCEQAWNFDPRVRGIGVQL